MIDNLDYHKAKVIKIDKEKDLALLEIIGFFCKACTIW